VPEFLDDLRLAGVLAAQNLDGVEEVAQLGVARLVDDGKATLAELVDQLIATADNALDVRREVELLGARAFASCCPLRCHVCSP
jgi:hypothetical protein